MTASNQAQGSKNTNEYSNQPTLVNPPLSNNPLSPEWQPNQYQPPAQHNWGNPSPTHYGQGYPQPAHFVQGQSGNAAGVSLFLAITALIIGLISATLGWLCFGFFTGPIAVILGLIAMVKRKMEGKSDLNLITHIIAIVGIVTGAIVPLVFGIAFLISFIQELMK